MTRAILFVLILCFTSKTFGKTFSECELVAELRKQGFPENQMKDWLCLINGESSRRTNVVGGPNADGSHDYGLFQINDRYWCSSNDKPGKACNVRCKGFGCSSTDQCRNKPVPNASRANFLTFCTPEYKRISVPLTPDHFFCQITQDLLLDDISLASQCTKKIFAVHGFNAWVAWVNKCKGRNLPNINC